MKKIIYLILILCVWAAPAQAQEQHDLFTQALQRHVVDGMVDYEQLCTDATFAEYMQQLSTVDPDALRSREEKLAFWINAYNAWTLKIICDNYPIESISELHTGGLLIGVVLKTTVWDKPLVTVNGQTTSLGRIEHKILRPVFEDARIHFAIVCAAKGCPPLRSEAYEADRLDAQLNDQGRVFLAQKDKNSFNADEQTAYLSPIFKWFKKDFGGNQQAVLQYAAQFLPAAQKKNLPDDFQGWRVKYTDYDWSLNEQ